MGGYKRDAFLSTLILIGELTAETLACAPRAPGVCKPCGLTGTSRNSSDDAKIVNGNDLGAGDVPWQVAIDAKNLLGVTAGRVQVNCGGALINADWVLTAAHCTFFKPVWELLGVFGVVSRAAGGSFTSKFDRKLEHPLYVLTFGFTTSYDFSLLHLEKTIDLTRFPNVRPVCWPTMDPGVGQQVTTSGWGLRCSNDFNPGCSQPDILQGIDSDTTAACPSSAVAHPAKFCVNAPSGKASCNGDSGGPVTAEVGGRREIWGLVSYGPKPCETKAYSVYAKVFAVRDWLYKEAGGPCL